MSSKQTRRSISIRGELYWKLKEVCEASGESMSSVVTRLVEGHLGGKKPVDRLSMIRQAAQKKAEPVTDATGIFTF